MTSPELREMKSLYWQKYSDEPITKNTFVDIDRQLPVTEQVMLWKE